MQGRRIFPVAPTTLVSDGEEESLPRQVIILARKRFLPVTLVRSSDVASIHR